MTAEAQIKDYLELLSSKAPVPGGGGASALAGALGDSLGQMVVHLTLGKKRYAQAEQDMLNYERELKRLQQEFRMQRCLPLWQNVTASPHQRRKKRHIRKR